MKSIYSTAELAEMFDVNESTVKRWSDQGHIECMKTQGGHRRFPIRSVLKFVHQNKISVPHLDPQLLKDENLRANVINGNVSVLVPQIRKAMLAGDADEVVRILRIGIAAKPDLLHLYHHLLFPPLVEIGDGWEKGEITVDVEHLASHAVHDALQRLQAELFQKPYNGKTALLACYEDDQHELPTRCINQYLTTQGWRTLFLGARTPTRSLVFSINRNKPDLVVLSSLVVDDDSKFVSDINEEIVPAVRSIGAKLAVGGASMVERFGNVLRSDVVSDAILDFEQIADGTANDNA